MQPPPRKGNYFKVCKNLHAEQLAKLQAKNQQECDLLEDIRNFTKQRSEIEKKYGEALCKISTTYQNKKLACVPDIRLEDGSEAWNIYSVWGSVLDETEKLGKCRLAAVEVFHQRISEDAKHTRQKKINLGKKLFDNLSMIQKELHSQVQELDRTKKCYYDEENVAYDAREKANAAEEKLKRKKGSIFQSISSLQKNSAKFTAKKELCDEKSLGARNDYLLALSLANSHQRRYYEIDFERIMRTVECGIFEKVSEYLNLLSRTELLTCTATQNSYSKIKEQAATVTRGYNLRCYLTFYPMLGKNIQYEFEPCKGDRIDKITFQDETSKEQLTAESTTAVQKILKEVKIIREASKKIQKLQSAKRVGGELPPEVENKIEEIRQIIRRSETNKYKAEAKLEALKEGGIEVEDYSKSLDADSMGTEIDNSLSRSRSSLSVKEEGEAKDFEADEDVAAGDRVTEKQYSTDSFDTEKEDVQYQYQESVTSVQKNLEPTNWDPTNLDWGDAPVSPLPPVTNGAAEEISYPKCIAQYNYTAQNPDELTIVENEELELVSEGDGDGWIQTRNYKGEVGYIPQNYVEMEDGSAVPAGGPLSNQSETTAAEASMNGAVSSFQYDTTENEELEAPVSFSSIDYSFEATEDNNEPSYDPPTELPPPPPAQIIEESTQLPSQPSLDVSSREVSKEQANYCIAMYDYEATCDEELTFIEGQILRILKRSVFDVDDGWWEGEMNGQVGLFPSLVVEECRPNGDLFTPEVFTFQDSPMSSPCTTPPPHTPPEVPGFLLPPEGIIITMPTPEVETVEEAIALKEQEEQGKVTSVGEHQQQYHRQFSSSPDSETATEKDQQYAELVSSPDVSNQEVTDPETLKDFDQSLTDSPDTVEELKEDTKNGVTNVSGGIARPTSAPPPPPVVVAPIEKTQNRITEKEDKTKDEEGLDVAQIVVTQPTPMVEIPEEEVKTSSDGSKAAVDQSEDDGQGESEDIEGEANFLEDDRGPPPPPAPEGGGGSGVEERHDEYESDYSLPSTVPEPLVELPKKTASPEVVAPKSMPLDTRGAEKEKSLDSCSTPTPKSPSPSDGPPDLDPEKLKTLERIRESIA